MCGIFAVLSRARPITADYNGVLDTLRHRGPDDGSFQLVDVGCAAVESPRRAWLGHRRLSIIDLSTRSRQPMSTPDGRWAIVYNGEIYNFVELREQCRLAGAEFRTDSDTEVLLHAWRLWGEACLSRLKGMFAFVVVDREAGTATLARDPFGIKPLYYALTPNELLVASEIPTLLSTGRVATDVDAAVAYEYLRFGATSQTERTLLREVTALPAAHVAVFEFRTGTLQPPRRYWKLAASARRISFPDAVDECRTRFLDNVRLHLRSDVPIGAALSGGIDSSAIVCAMRMLEPDLDLQTFSYIAADAAHTEERWVDLVHEQVGGAAHKIRPSAEDLSAELIALVRRQGEPFGSASMFAQYHVFERARAEGVPVTLDGQGADELLGGYWPHVGTAAAERLRAGDVAGVLKLMSAAAPGARGKALVAAMLAQSLLPVGLRHAGRAAIGRGVIPSYLDREWFEAEGVNIDNEAENLIGRFDTLKEHLIDNVERGSLPNLLRYADRNAMAASIESRVPFLTADFAEFLMSLPPAYLVSPEGVRKFVFREAMKGILPEPIRQRRDKIGFFADDSLWLRKNRAALEPAAKELGRLPMFRAPALARFFADFWSGNHDKGALVWRALVFGYWFQDVRRIASEATA